jgi:hypothetical protein
MISDLVLQKKYASVLPHLDKRTARLYLGSEAESLGRGGKQRVAKLAGVSRIRIDKGILELSSAREEEDQDQTTQRLRKPGGGRKRHEEKQAGLIEALEAIVA